MDLICIILGLIIYALIEGHKDAYLEHHRSTSANPDYKNLHPLFAVTRILIGVLIFFYINLPILIGLSFLLCLGLIFSWFHNGNYFLTRNKLTPNIYKKKWKDESTTSNAILEFNYIERSILLILGIIGLIIITYGLK